MRVKYQVVAESNTHYKCRIKTNPFDKSKDKYSWFPKSVCSIEIEPDLYSITLRKVKVVINIEDWYYHKHFEKFN